MPIQDSDLFLININSDAQSFKITASKLKESLAPNLYNNYKLLVNKPDYTSRFVYTQNLQQSVAPTDYMMVERAGVSYKVTGQQVMDYFPSVPAGAAGPIVDLLNIPINNNITPEPSPNVFKSPPIFNAKYNSGSVLPLPSTTITFEFNNAWDLSEATQFRGGSYSANETITLTFTDINGTVQSATNTTAASYAGSHSLSSIDFSVPIKTLVIAIANATGYFWGFYDSSENGVRYPSSTTNSQLTLASNTNLDLFTVGDAISMVNEDGDVASYTPVTSTITNVAENVLTFASPNKDLKYFNPGDIVQVNGVSYPVTEDTGPNLNADTTSLATANIYDKNLRTYFEYWSSGGGNSRGGSFTVTFPTPLVNSSGLKLATAYASSSPRVVSIQINGIAYNVTNDWEQGEEIPLVEILNAPATINSITIVAGYGNATLGGIEINGVLLGGEIKAVSIDAAANTMVVDGGNWTGSDGTSSGDAADRETQVTGPAKSGTANFQAVGYNIGGNNLPFVTTANSNEQWIDNTNRLGEEFFIKSASTRTGLAILRTKAITQAQAWVADAGYLAQQIVKHNGRYWFALLSNYANSPDGTDTSDWFDLGAIEPVAVNGYYPLYLAADEADAASSSNSHHVHTFDGVDYYMPNGGTIYHGNYAG